MRNTYEELEFPRLLNIRDLGRYRTRAGRQLRPRSLLRSDDLYRLTPAGAEALLNYGVRTVLDLRFPSDIEQRPNAFHQSPGRVNHVHVSLMGTSMEDWQARRPPGPKERFNCHLLDLSQAENAAALRTIATASEGTILFHCVSGKDRTGFIAAMLLALVDVDVEVIAQDYALSTEKLREAYLAKYPDMREAVLERVRCPPEQIHNMMAHLAAHYEGVEGYLHRIGLTDGEIDGLKARLL